MSCSYSPFWRSSQFWAQLWCMLWPLYSFLTVLTVTLVFGVLCQQWVSEHAWAHWLELYSLRSLKVQTSYPSIACMLATFVLAVFISIKCLPQYWGMAVYLTPLVNAWTAVGKDPRQIALTQILSKVVDLCSLIKYRLTFTNLPF